ncbi:hypothetical protein Vafri_14487, partial [Volvox africanus]
MKVGMALDAITRKYHINRVFAPSCHSRLACEIGLHCLALCNKEDQQGRSLNFLRLRTKTSNVTRLPQKGPSLKRAIGQFLPLPMNKGLCIILALAFPWEAHRGGCEGVTEEQYVSRSLSLPKERRGRLPLSSSVLNVSDGYQFVAALLNPTIDIIKLAAPIVDVPLDAWNISGTDLPIIITRNLTTEGDEVDWPLFRLHYVKDMMRLEGNVTWTIRFVFLDGAFRKDIYRSEGLAILSPTAPNQASELLIGPAAVSFRLCFPATKSPDLNLLDRPARYPGNQTIKYGLPMTGCLNGSSVPPLRRCWATKAIMVDVAGQGVIIDPASDLPVSINIFVWMRNVSGFCEYVVDANCLARSKYEPLVCFKETLQRYQNDPDFLDDYQPQGALSGGMQPASVPQQSAVIPTSGGRRHSKAVVGAVAGAVVASVLVIAVMAAVAMVLWRRRRRKHATYRSVVSSGSKPKSTFGWRMSSPAFNSVSCPDIPAAGGAGLDSGFSMGLQQSSEPDRGLSAERCLGSTHEYEQADQIQDKSILQTALVAVECDPVTPHTEPRPNLDLHVRLVNANSLFRSRTEMKGSTANSNIHKPGVGTASTGSDSADGRRFQPAASYTNTSAPAGPSQVENDADGDAGPQSAVTNYSNSFLEAVSCQPVSTGVEGAIGGSGDGGSSGSGVVELSQVVRGKGAFGRVMEGTYNGERVAVKLLACDWPWGEPTEAFTRCFAQELEVLSRCQHPNVVRLLAACVDAPRLCLVLELMETSLERVIYGDPTAPLMPLEK